MIWSALHVARPSVEYWQKKEFGEDKPRPKFGNFLTVALGCSDILGIP